MDADFNAVASARECDALNDEDVTPLPASQPHVVFRLRREEDENVPWIVELVFLLFNAQGDVLQVVRGARSPDTSSNSHHTGSSHSVTFFGEENLRATRAKSKEAHEREVVRFSVAKLHPYVEIVGCLVTYAEDEIARCPQLNAFSLTCDLHAVDSAQAEADAQALAAGGKRFVFNAGERTRLLGISHDPKSVRRQLGKQPNVVVLCKFFRRHGDHHDWAFHAASDDRSNVVVRSAVTASLVEAMQIFLLDLMPDLKIPNRNPLSSVTGICAALSCNEFLGIETHFPDDGLLKVDFARLLLWELMRTRPSLMQHLNRATALVGLLFEMFEQIDINGDAVVDWEEFTSFCVAIGLVATRIPHDDNDHDQGQPQGDPNDAPPRSMIVYRQEPLSSGTAARTFPYQVNKLKAFPQLKRLAVIEHKSPRILMFDLDMNFLHELNCSEKLAAEKKAGEKQADVFDSLEVLDAEHVPSRNALAIASSDLCISLWSIIDATVGSYVFNGKLVGRFPALFVKWCPPPLKRLFVAGGSTDQVQLWDLEVPMHAGAAPPPPPMLLPRHHTERLAACLDLPETPYVATASFDHTITVWETVAGTNSSVGGPSAVLTVSFVLRGHQQAVLTLDSAHTLLLSSGFEYQAYCWGIPGRTLKTKLGGHHHCLMGAKFVSPSATGPCLAVTGDQSGHFKLWDVTRCAKGFSGNHLATMLQTFELHTPNLCRFRMFMTSSNGPEKAHEPHHEPGTNGTSESPACDIITGNLRLYRFSAAMQSVGQDEAVVDESSRIAPTRFVVFNAVANTFVGVVENRITVWSANSGAKIEEPVSIRDAEVCAIAFDSPRERKLFVATNDGAIRLYNPVTGALLQSVPWPGELLSLGVDGVVKIWDNTATCVGHILTTGEQSSASASAWKFVRRDHTVGGDQKDLFERIAREVIAKHRRRLKKELNHQRKTGQSDQVVADPSLTTPSSLMETESPSKMPETPLFPDASTALASAASVLLLQAPFSVTSVASGIQQGVFGPEEAQHLRSIAQNSTALLADITDKKKRIAALAPLFSTPEEMGRARAKAKAKARAMMNNGPQTPEPPSAASKTLTNYPLELERRAAAVAKASVGALRTLDVEPSQFLRDKLQDAASPMSKPVKSTPKKRLQRASMGSTSLDIKMNASVVILARNVSLPKLTPPSFVQELNGMLHSPGTLISSASAPILPQSSSPILTESTATNPEKLRRNSNIERKLKLCQKIVANVCLMSSKPKAHKDHAEQHQPISPTASMRHSPALSPGKNPFGPHYTFKQVEQLAMGLARLDEDGSGDLNQHEWTQLVKFCGLEGSDRRNSATSVESLFYSIDRDANGSISLRELLPTLFRQASPEQLQQMRALIQTRMKLLRARSTSDGSSL
ncbi:hypothetical protein PF003_g35997 [Phytophthora fragariae]|nr:hypothetical protein PF003_g35997 [Phytophthora fragariae]